MGFNFPNSPTINQVYPVTVTPGMPQWIWDGQSWVIKSSNVSPTIYISDTPPVSPSVGQLWYKSDTGDTYIWMNDGTSLQWIQQNLGVGTKGDTGPMGPQGAWTQITQAAYNLLSPPNPAVLYVIVG